MWALVVVAPDFYRVTTPLATLGFQADNSGLIYQTATTQGATGRGSAVQTLKTGDRIVLSPGACWTPTSQRCRDYLAVFGGMAGLDYVWPGTVVTLTIQPAGVGRPTDVRIAAQVQDLDAATAIFLALCEIAAVIVLWQAFRLAWTSPSRMTIGFFLFAMWFNPGQYFVLYAWLQQHPLLLLVQESLQAIAQGAGYAGFLIFALRFPNNVLAEPGDDGHWLRHMERAAMVLGVVLAVLQLASFLNVLGVPTETVTWFAIFGGYAVAIVAGIAVWLRLRYQSPLDYQRMLWVLWGCAIGIPAFIFADSNEATSLWAKYIWNHGILSDFQPQSELAYELGFLLSGVLTIFISVAFRHRRIVNVTPELRALVATIVILVAGVLVEQSMHERITEFLKKMDIPEGVHLYLAVVPLVLVSWAVHRSSHAVEHLLNRSFYTAKQALKEARKKAMQVEEEDIDDLLLHAPIDALNMASGAVFREMDGAFRTVSKSEEWNDKLLDLAAPEHQALIERLRKGVLARLPARSRDPSDVNDDDATAPALAIPVAKFENPLYAIVAYGAHRNGAALDRLELGLLQQFIGSAATGYEHAEARRFHRANST